jgi:hypothetical protein
MKKLCLGLMTVAFIWSTYDPDQPLKLEMGVGEFSTEVYSICRRCASEQAEPSGSRLAQLCRENERLGVWIGRLSGYISTARGAGRSLRADIRYPVTENYSQAGKSILPQVLLTAMEDSGSNYVPINELTLGLVISDPGLLRLRNEIARLTSCAAEVFGETYMRASLEEKKATITLSTNTLGTLMVPGGRGFYRTAEANKLYEDPTYTLTQILVASPDPRGATEMTVTTTGPSRAPHGNACMFAFRACAQIRSLIKSAELAEVPSEEKDLAGKRYINLLVPVAHEPGAEFGGCVISPATIPEPVVPAPAEGSRAS